CVLPKIGIAADQYTLPNGGGRVRFYIDNGANFPGGAPPASQLYDSLAEMKKYDMIVIDCVGGEYPEAATRRANLEAYASAGGRAPAATATAPAATARPAAAVVARVGAAAAAPAGRRRARRTASTAESSPTGAAAR